MISLVFRQYSMSSCGGDLAGAIGTAVVGRCRLSDEGDDLHFATADRTDIDLNFEYSGQKRCPRQTIRGGDCFLPLIVFVFFG